MTVPVIGRAPAVRIVVLLLTAALLAALGEPRDRSEPEPVEPLAGQLLIASAAIHDPRFHHSVILVVHHDRNGSLGIMINRPLGERPLGSVLGEPDSGKADVAEGSIEVYFGGPVQPELGFVLHDADYRRPDTRAVADGVAITTTREALHDIGRHQGPAKYLFAAGYAGWGAGQLESEIARRDWFTAPATPDLVFDIDRAAVWDAAMARRAREL